MSDDTKTEETVSIERELDGMTVADAIAWLGKTFPPHAKFDLDRDYESGDTLYVRWVRDKTPEELRNEAEWSARYERDREASERAQYERLKAKFGKSE